LLAAGIHLRVAVKHTSWTVNIWMLAPVVGPGNMLTVFPFAESSGMQAADACADCNNNAVIEDNGQTAPADLHRPTVAE
jgi:hypothetical protein